MHENVETVRNALRENSDRVVAELADLIIALGALRAWDMEINYDTTETVAGLAARVGLPSASGQGDDALRFYGAAAADRGFEYADDGEDVDADGGSL